MLIYDKSGRELRHRILLSFFVLEIWPSEGLTLLRFLVWSSSAFLTLNLTKLGQKLDFLAYPQGQRYCSDLTFDI